MELSVLLLLGRHKSRYMCLLYRAAHKPPSSLIDLLIRSLGVDALVTRMVNSGHQPVAKRATGLCQNAALTYRYFENHDPALPGPRPLIWTECKASSEVRVQPARRSFSFQ